MADTPKPTIEDLLKACAQRQRDLAGEPIQLDSVARSQLLQEVTRTYSPPTSSIPARRSWWSMLWPRLAWGGGALAILIVLLIASWPILRPHRTEVQMAKNSEIVAMDSELMRPDAKFEVSQIDKRRTVDFQPATVESRPAPTAVAPRPSAASDFYPALQAKTVTNMTGAESQIRRYGRVAAPPPSAKEKADQPASPQVALTRSSPSRDIVQGRAGDGQAGTAVVSQQFRQDSARPAYRRNYNSPPLPKVLDTFRVEQNAESFLVIDQDGSVYSGAIRALSIPHALAYSAKDQKEAAFASNVASQPALPDNNAQSGQQFEFTVQGTNLTLQQKVVFQGQYLQAPAVLSGRPLQNAPFSSAQTGLGQQSQMGVSAPRISGTVVVGQTNQLAVDAFLEEPPQNP